MNISKGTIVRTVVLVVALINSVLTMTGKNPLPFSDDEVYSGVSAVVTVVAALVAWWKNNSFTLAAIKGDETMKIAKAEGAAENEVDETGAE